MTTSFSFFVAEAVSAVYALFIHKNHLADSRRRQSRNDSRNHRTGLQNSSIERPVERHPAGPQNEKGKSDDIARLPGFLAHCQHLLHACLSFEEASLCNGRCEKARAGKEGNAVPSFTRRPSPRTPAHLLFSHRNSQTVWNSFCRIHKYCNNRNHILR